MVKNFAVFRKITALLEALFLKQYENTRHPCKMGAGIFGGDEGS